MEEITPDLDTRKLFLSQRRRTFQGKLGAVWDWVYEQTNFFRLHLSAFVFVPLIVSGIFYASNGQFRIAYLDCLFLCYSAMTGTGLTTRNLSNITGFQQALLFILMGLGTTTTTSWLMLLARRKFLHSECEYLYWELKRKLDSEKGGSPQIKTSDILGPTDVWRHDFDINTPPTRPPWLDIPAGPENVSRRAPPSHFDAPGKPVEELVDNHLTDREVLSSSPTALSVELPPISPTQNGITWHPQHTPIRQRRPLVFDESRTAESRTTQPTSRSMLEPRRSLSRGMTIVTVNGPFPSRVPGIKAKYQGLGGFPGPIQLIHRAVKHFTPKTYGKIHRTMTMQTVNTIEVAGVNDIKTGRNSDIPTADLPDSEVEKIAGMEYRAIVLLIWLIPVYFVAVQLITFLVFGPWLVATKKYDHVFLDQPRVVSKSWYAFFLTMSAYSGTGLDLCDTAMVPFQAAYPMIFGIMFCLLAGNHALPVLLRFLAWAMKRFSDKNSDFHKTLQFLLDHPRRSYLYLFPAAQTWFLFIVLCSLSAIEWSSFGVLNLGLPVFEDLPVGVRVVAGLFQGIATRASGLSIVAVGELAPAIQFLYVVLMYIAVYPVGMCIRATNVYEEKSLGIFEAEEGGMTEDLGSMSVRAGVGRYLGWHVRHQMAIDIWWLVWGILLVTIIERGNIMNADKPYLALFPIIFELVSAFAGIGMSLGWPGDNYSLVGTMGPLSKLVVIVIMIRGRHRGLPVAVDRAIIFPGDLVTNPTKKATMDVTAMNEVPIPT